LLNSRQWRCVSVSTGAEFLDVIGTKLLIVFLLILLPPPPPQQKWFETVL
jgi:hypothetical protein